jgi:hypothetical protein
MYIIIRYMLELVDVEIMKEIGLDGASNRRHTQIDRAST